MARIHPLPEGAWSSELLEIFSRLPAGVREQGAPPRILTTLARNAELFRTWIPFGMKLLVQSGLPPRDRELATLRVAWNCRAEYVWGNHAVIARELGFTEAELAAIPAFGKNAEHPWSAADRSILRACDELHTDKRLSAGTWAELAERYDEEQLIEFPMLVGQYAMIAMTLNSLGLEPEQGTPGLPAEPV